MWLFKKIKHREDEDLASEYYDSGDKELVGHIFEKHVKTVYGVCLFYFRDKDVAKDMVMQIFEKLISELKKTRVRNFKAWLSFVVRNHCLSELRKTTHKHFVSEAYLDFELKDTSYLTETAIETIDEEQLLENMINCLSLLKENQRKCVELFYLKERSYQDISNETKLSLNEVKSNIQNGKRNLKLMIEEKIKNKNNAH